MALNEEWYLDEIELDDTNSFIADLHANAGDLNGRGISLTVAHNSQPVDMTGMSVYLAWGHEFSGEGLEKFTAINAAQGRWKVLYPNAMQRRGKVLARVMIYLTGKDTPITSSNNFRIHVAANPINDKTLVADNDFSVFQRAVVDLHEAEGCATASTTAANTAAASANTAASASTTQTAACAAATNAALDVATTALSKRRADSTYANALVGSVRGAMVHVEDAWGADAVECRVEGKSAQVATTGKNLLRCIKTAPETINGVTFTPMPDGGIKVAGTASGPTTYNIDSRGTLATAVSIPPAGACFASGQISASPVFGLHYFTADGLSKQLSDAGTTGRAITYPADAVKMSNVLYVATGTNVNEVAYPQIELGSAATPFEPYSGGKPSPSPDYPQEVDVVDGPVVVHAAGKNLMLGRGFRADNGLTYDRNSDGTYTVNGTAVGIVSNVWFWGYFGAGSKLMRVHVGDTFAIADCVAFIVWDSSPKTLSPYETNVEAKECGWLAGVRAKLSQAGKVYSDVIEKPQIEVGAVATAFETPVLTDRTITLPAAHNYLASLPDGTRDTLALRADGVAVLVERTNKRVFDGSSDEGWVYEAGASFPFRLRDAALGSEYRQLLCDRYATRAFAATTEAHGLTVSKTSATNDFCFRDTGIDQTPAAWRAKLAANPVTAIYAIATTLTRYSADNGTTWSTTDPAAGMSAVQLHKGTNNVWCTDPLSPDVALDYVQDTNKVIAELRAAVVASGATR